MTQGDTFASIARFYDPMMAHVDYGRWVRIARSISGHLLPGFRHLDVGCGTGVLLAQLRAAGWNSVGLDLSYAMLAQGRHAHTICGDMRALPLGPHFDLVTCLFDSVNFVVDEDELRTAFIEFARVLRPGGLLYFDVVTERMVLKHFIGPEWTEEHDGFTTVWYTHYDRPKRIAQTHVRVGMAPSSVIVERMHPIPVLKSAVQGAGLELLACFDVDDHRPPSGKSCRVDFIAVKLPHALPFAFTQDLARQLA